MSKPDSVHARLDPTPSPSLVLKFVGVLNKINVSNLARLEPITSWRQKERLTDGPQSVLLEVIHHNIYSLKTKQGF